MLTEKIAKDHPAPKTGVVEVLDDGPGGQRGLLLRVTANGVRSWCVRWSLRGRRHRQTIGRVGEMPLRLARSKAAAIRGAVDQGVSPEVAEGRSLTALWEDYAVERARVLKHPHLDRRIFDNHLRAALAHRRPDEFSRADWFRLAEGLAAKGLAPNTRRNVHRVLSGFFGWLLERELVEVSPIPSKPPARRVNRDRVPTVEDLRAILAAAEGEGVGGQVVTLLVLTGLRREEARGLLWSEVLDGEIVIGSDRMKAGRAHRVPLSSRARALIAERREECGRWSRFVFPGSRRMREGGRDRPTGAKFSEIVSTAAPGCTVHDIRRGVASGLAGLGTPPHLIGLTLAHSPSSVVGSVTSVYLRSEYLPERREALERWCEVLRG